MATVQEAVRRLRIEATSTGVKEAKADLDALARSQDGVAVAADETSRATLSLEKRFDSIERRYNATIRAQQEYDKVQRQVNAAVQQNPALQDRANALLAMARERLNQVTGAANDNAAATGLARHELINLSRQAQDVAVSLAGGMSPLTVLMQQGSQIGDIFTSSQGTVGGFFKQVTGSLSGFLTAGRLAFGGVTLAIGASVSALFSYLDAQQKVNLALTGIGRGSGLTAANINAAASGGASAGFSVAEARELASAIAATGKVANDNLLPIVKMGKDFATTFGVDAVEASKMLAQSFADPVKGAEQLNERLGFMDAAMQRQIASLVAQNRLYDAQKVLLAGVQSSLAKTAEVTSFWSQVWSGLKSTASNVFDTVGEKLAHFLSLDLSLQQQKDRLEKELASYDSTLGRIFGTQADRDKVIRQLDEVNKLLDAQRQATQNVAAAQASLRMQQTIMAQLPEVAQRQTLADQASVAGAVAEDPLLQKSLGVTQEQADRVRSILNQVKNDFKTTFEEIRAGSKIAMDAVTAFSPAAKAMIAARQAAEQYRSAGGLDESEKATITQDAYNLSLKQSVTALSEAARSRELSARQAAASAELEIRLVGKSIGQQAEMRANLQARQQLEQIASQNRTAFDEAEYDRLKKINAEYAARVQLAAKAQIADQIKFDRATIGLSQEDVQIAQQLRSIYPDVATALTSVEAGEIRLNNQLREGKQIATDFGTALLSGLMRGEGVMKSLTGAATSLITQLASKNLQSFLNGGSLFGNQSLGSAQGALGMASAGLAGYQSGNALTGALGGAMAGATFGPMGAVAGGILGLVGGIFGANEQSKKKLEEAQRVWKKAGPAFQQFLNEMSGGVQGELMNRVASARQRASELGDKAWEAGDYAAVRRIVDSYSKYVQDQSRAFLATFQATARGLGDGLGMDSPFLKAVSTIKDQLASVQSFIDDTRTSTGILSGALSEDTLALTGNAAAIAYMNGEVAKATDVSRTYLLSLLGTAPQLSTVATRMLDIQGRAAALQGALEQLGMSSGDAAAAIAGGVQKAIADLKKSFEGGLTSRLNTATGKGYMNDALALLAQRNQDIADAASLGLDMNLVSTVFAAEAQKIVDDAGLVGDAFNEFTTIFPDLAGVVTQSASAIEKAAQAQKQALDASAKSILDYLNSLTAGTASTLAPAERLAAAQAAYNAKLTLAQGGNLDAQSSIVQDAENLRLAAQAMYASGAQYQAVVAAIKSQLSGLSSVQQTTDPLLVAMRDVQSAVIGTTTAVHGTTGAVNTTGAANDNLQTVQNQLAAQQVNYLASQQALLGAINNLTVSGNTTADRIINAINGLGQLTYDATKSQNDLLLLMVFALGGHGSPPPIPGWPGFQNGGVIPGYAAGGVIANGLYGIDSVVARLPNGRPIGLAGGEFVMPADQTRRFLPQLEGMRQGRPTGESLDWQPLARAIKQAIDISDERLLAKIDELIASNEASAPRIKDALRQIVAGAKPRAA